MSSLSLFKYIKVKNRNASDLQRDLKAVGLFVGVDPNSPKKAVFLCRNRS